MTTLLDPMSFRQGPAMKNRFMLAPLTNSQSQEDGVLSDEVPLAHDADPRRFGLTMTCAAHVQAIGKGFRQLGAFGDEHLDGLAVSWPASTQRTVSASSNSTTPGCAHQLNSSGSRVPVVGRRGDGCWALGHDEVLQLIDDFVAAAVRSERAGFDGVEIHGAHGYIVAQFLSPEINQRDDEFGGSLENRVRLLFGIIDGIREQCGPDFILGVRLSPERFGLQLAEMIDVAERLLAEQQIDFLDLSLWDVFKEPEEATFAGRTLMSCFTDLDRGMSDSAWRARSERPRMPNGRSPQVWIGSCLAGPRSTPRLQNRYAADPRFVPVGDGEPVPRRRGLSEAFITYMAGWKGFVADQLAVASRSSPAVPFASFRSSTAGTPLW